MTAPPTQILDVLGHGFGGEGYAKVSEGYVSLPRALPGDRVEAEVGDFVRGRAWGRVVRWLHEAPGRVAPDCPHYGECSGCALRHVARADERAFKLAQAAAILRRYGPADAPATDDLEWIGQPERLGHRTRGAFGVEVRDGRVVLGLRSLTLDRRLVDIRDCPAQSARFRAVMTAVGGILDGAPDAARGLRRVALEVTADAGRLALFGDAPFAEPVATELRDLAARESLALSYPDVPLSTDALALAHPLGASGDVLQVQAPLGSWHHAAPGPARLLADWVAARVAERAARRVLDLCCGLGTITARLAPDVDWLLAVDEDRHAVGALDTALRAAVLDHVHTRVGRLGAVLRKLRRDPNARAELAVINPMRKALGRAQLRDLPALGVTTVIYLGPAPVSAARDAAVLAQLGYRPTRAVVVDLHPGTAQFMLAGVFERQA